MQNPGEETGLYVSAEGGSSPVEADEPTELIRKRAFGRPVKQLPPDKLAVFLRDLQRQRWKLGVKVTAEDLLRDHPALRESPELFTLIYGEYVLREEYGETPSLKDFGQRFPNHLDRLQRQLRLHRMMEKSSGLIKRPKLADSVGKVEAAPESTSEWPEIAGYEILDELGRGGMGIVYRARQLGLNRIVALKMLLGGPFANPTFQSRFRSEAEVIGRMQHPNIVQVFAVGTQESKLGADFSCPYFSQEFIDGGSLLEELGGKPRPPADASQLVETLARAVHYAHQQGIVHRDLKSANILLTGAGVPKISDFGLAKQLDAPTGETLQGTIMGTPEYMAPEQAAGQTDIGPAADIYALGVILYELVTGRPPFQGPTLDVLAQVQTREPMPLTMLQTRTPRDLETICLKCLRKEPRQRYASALDLVEDLARFQKGEPIRARPVGRIERLWRWIKRHPAVTLLTTLTVLLTLAGTIAVTAAWLHALAGWGEADHLRGEAVEEQAEAEIRQEQAEATLYFSRIAEANLERRSDNVRSAEALLDACIPKAGARDRRGWEWHYLKGLQHADLLTIPVAHDEFVTDVAISPDGQTLATAGGTPFLDSQNSNGIRIWKLSGPDAGSRRLDLPQSSMGTHVAFRPDGKALSWTDLRGQVGVVDLDTRKNQFLWKLPPGFEGTVLSQDGGRFAAVNEAEHLIKVWDIETNAELLAIASAEVRNSTSVGFDQSSQRLAIALATTVEIWDLASKQKVQTLTPVRALHGKPAFSHDGKLLAYGTDKGQVQVWDLTCEQLIHSMAGHAGSVTAVAFAPGSRHVASAGADQTVRVWNLEEGLEITRLRGHQGRASCLSFSPSGKSLASGSEQPAEVKIWDLTRQQEYVSVMPSAQAKRIVEGLAFNANGETIQALRNSGALQLADANTGVERQVTTLNFGGIWRVPAALASFSGTGRTLAFTSQTDRRVVEIVDPTSGKTLRKLEHGAEVLYVALSRDGSTLATSAHNFKDPASRREVRVWDVATGRLKTTIKSPLFFTNHIYGAVAISDDGSKLAYDEYLPTGEKPAEDHVAIQVHIRDLTTGQIVRTLDKLPSLVRSLAFSPDGSRLAIGCDLGGVFVYDSQADRWQLDQPLPGSAFDYFMDLSFSPDGRRLAGVGQVQLQMWDADSGSAVLALRGAPPRPKDVGFNPRVTWSPDGRRLAASHWNGSVSIWDAGDRRTLKTKRAAFK